MISEPRKDDTLISSEQWDDLYTGIKPKIAPGKDQFRNWLERNVPGSPGTCLEIGCYPGRYLSVMGEMGYRLYGVDLAEKLPELKSWLEKNGYRTGTFWHADFFDFHPEMQFDIVMSLGFIEHYRNWKDVLKKHFPLVREGGLLILEAPNFIGTFQRWIHRCLDRGNYEQHFPEAMDIDEWVPVLERNGFELLFSGYIGKFDFWVQDEERSFFSRLALKLLHYIRPVAAVLPAGSRSYSPYAAVIARKSGRNHSI